MVEGPHGIIQSGGIKLVSGYCRTLGLDRENFTVHRCDGCGTLGLSTNEQHKPINWEFPDLCGYCGYGSPSPEIEDTDPKVYDLS